MADTYLEQWKDRFGHGTVERSLWTRNSRPTLICDCGSESEVPRRASSVKAFIHGADDYH
jgi:hypothetical protein